MNREQRELDTPELVAWCFASCPYERVPNDSQHLHSALAKLRRDHGGPDGPLGDFIFKSVTIYPWSDLLSDILDALKFGRVLRTMTPDYEDLIVCPKWRERFLASTDDRVPAEWREVAGQWLPQVVQRWEAAEKKQYDGGTFQWQKTPV